MSIAIASRRAAPASDSAVLAELLFRESDDALYAAKRAGGAPIVLAGAAEKTGEPASRA